MRNLASCALVGLVGFAVASCESRLPTADTGRAPAAVSGATADLLPSTPGMLGRDHRPFAATLTGAATFAVPAGCPPACAAFTTITDATGQATHLGRVQVHSTHRPYDVADHQDGAIAITAANGDQLYGVYDYQLSNPGPIAVTITGGTGRFADATGTIVMTAKVVQQFKPIPPCDRQTDPFGCLNPDVPWPWSATVTGAIGY